MKPKGEWAETIECFHMTSRWPCWCPKPVPWELNSFLMQALSFVTINLHRCWPREWKHSIDLFSLYALFSHLRPCDCTPEKSFFQMSSYTRASTGICQRVMFFLLYGETNSTKAKGGNRDVIERYDTHKGDLRKIRHSGPGWSGVRNLTSGLVPSKTLSSI